MHDYQYLINASEHIREHLYNIIDNTKQETTKPIIAVWGLMNAGKSYLLNMLSNNIDHEFFKTNDIRETAELKRLELGDRIYLDTPGLDANKVDDMIALQGASKADVVLFVHQLQGELEQVEIDFLQNIRQSFGKFADKNIIMVISKVDKESLEKVDEIQNKVLMQCQEVLGFTPTCFQISNTRYRKGVQEHKDGMVKASHIDDLKHYLDSQALTQITQIRQQRQTHKIHEYVQALEQIDSQLADIQKTMFAPYQEAITFVSKILTKETIKEIKRFENKYQKI